MDGQNTKVNLDQSLIAYAFLAQTTRVEGDLFSGLMPIFKRVAKKHEGKLFDAELLSQELASLYGLKVSPSALEDFLPRLESAGVVTNISADKEVSQYVFAQIGNSFDEVQSEDIRFVIDAVSDHLETSVTPGTA